MHHTVINEVSDLKKIDTNLVNKLEKSNVIMFIRMNGCYYCEMMIPEWIKMIKETKNIDGLIVMEIERNVLSDLEKKNKYFASKFSKIEGFPTIQMDNSKHVLTPFADERSSKQLLNFIHSNSTPTSDSKPVVKKLAAKKPVDKKKEDKKKEDKKKEDKKKKDKKKKDDKKK